MLLNGTKNPNKTHKRNSRTAKSLAVGTGYRSRRRRPDLSTRWIPGTRCDAWQPAPRVSVVRTGGQDAPLSPNNRRRRSASQAVQVWVCRSHRFLQLGPRPTECFQPSVQSARWRPPIQNQEANPASLEVAYRRWPQNQPAANLSATMCYHPEVKTCHCSCI